MAYGGGTYTRGVYPADDLPGAYTNIRSEEVKTLYPGIGGVVAVAIPLDWGAENKLIRIDARGFAENALKVFGVPANDPSLMPIREILAGGAKSVLVFRMNGVSTKAKTPTEIDGTPVAIGQIAEARYGGAVGNNLATACLEVIGIEDALEVQTLLYGQVVDSQIVSATVDPDTYDLVGDWDDLIDNEWIVWNRSGGDLIPHEATPLSDGVSGEPSALQTTAFRHELGKVEFDTLVVSTDDAVEKQINANWINSLYTDSGIRARVVLADYAGDSRRVINVTTKAKGDDPDAFIYFTAGCDASSPPGTSNTNRTYTGELKLAEEPSQETLKQAIRKGEFVYHTEYDKVCVLKDLNSFVSTSSEFNDNFKHPNTIRTIDYFENGVTYIFKKNFLGKVKMDKDGLNSLKGQIIAFGDSMVEMGALSEFNGYEVDVKAIGTDAVNASYVLRISGIADKLYLEGILK